jgi:hypothetical protein
MVLSIFSIAAGSILFKLKLSGIEGTWIPGVICLLHLFDRLPFSTIFEESVLLSQRHLDSGLGQYKFVHFWHLAHFFFLQCFIHKGSIVVICI